ncbi:Asp-tRNA(Asn)/Glu-tRNA(Gln) amidotransferase subunit GatC [Candidatus Kinetoplastidibacterium crithidiae]|uniref:Glutamyl-tRNA(Gln) amidotransferase subunit C n=1 Tax=Candidatus Kinetoplastidibacterium crithidiae TCC036E TaxID=1208918 RepID=M1M782_9PROT|nr:Asp-tRNA(Asn)/Glu-tRNA(Gln) amidotransferase subunit GatC [Candidatus Kinetoplastibacterium crithidii]AFZ82946.1 aspartyl-tRNA(Asn)/glutamyl-tRNA (Gln) amidotransferase subunit C [Candidatus Kinetoplastibacterium crithidii (ex Angomonas deanei ATCC 30255)]AGF47945.1 aspartyl-tRNA(Asn)/glutamyl-tRNA (Gln) amidotransferase subunit C [Candidatus Kinetoplastibacterium crithidii TCC036E]
MALNKIDINNIATISRIEITKEEIGIFEKELNKVIKIIEKVQDIKIDDIEPLVSPISIIDTFNKHLREDINPQTCSQEFMETIIHNSPEFENNLFIVPKIIE